MKRLTAIASLVIATLTVLSLIGGAMWSASSRVNAMDNQLRLNEAQTIQNSMELKGFRYERLLIWIKNLEAKCRARHCAADAVETLIRYKTKKRKLEKELGY